jgi:hypothetical protein
VLSEPITQALDELARARANVNRVKNKQVHGAEDRLLLRATADAWFHTHRKAVLKHSDPELLARVDGSYHVILSGADRHTAKQKYLGAMKTAKDALIELRKHLVVVNVSADAAPKFAPLSTDADMQAILERRWIECPKCVEVKAHLAATVMMGGLLEALFVARVQQLSDKSLLFKQPSTPMKQGKAMPLAEWMLRSYIEVGHDLGWITRSARDLAGVLGEYRNYVHPEKERRHKVTLKEDDSEILWGVTKNLVSQLLNSAKP